MATKGALPKAFRHVHPRYKVPWTGSIVFAGLALVWFVVLSAVSQNVLGDSIAATGLMVAVYYTLGGIACPIFYRRRLLRGEGDARAPVVAVCPPVPCPRISR